MCFDISGINGISKRTFGFSKISIFIFDRKSQTWGQEWRKNILASRIVSQYRIVRNYWSIFHHFWRKKQCPVSRYTDFFCYSRLLFCVKMPLPLPLKLTIFISHNKVSYFKYFDYNVFMIFFYGQDLPQFASVRFHGSENYITTETAGVSMWLIVFYLSEFVFLFQYLVIYLHIQERSRKKKCLTKRQNLNIFFKKYIL